MLLPRDLLYQNYTKPQVILCETDKTKICNLDTQDLNGTFKFNSYSEITFNVSRTNLDIITGETKVNPFYNKIEALRLIYIPGFGYFEIQEPNIIGDGLKEVKEVTAFSLEYILSQRYLIDFVINTPDNSMNIGGGTPESEESDPVVQFYNPNDVTHSLLHLALHKAYGWTIGHIDSALASQTRSFTVDRASIYDFLMNDVASTFKCYFIFDTINNTVNAYAETASVKFNGDGSSRTFTLPTPFTVLGSVTLNGYKTTDYTYNNKTGVLTFTTAPTLNTIIEVEDGEMAEWETDVFISFDSLASEMQINYSADDIKTVLRVVGADDMDIRDANLGLDYIMDLSYYHTVDWMGQDLYDAYTAYITKVNQNMPIYTGYVEQLNGLWDTYYEIQSGTSTDLTALKLSHFKTMLQYYYKNKEITKGTIDKESIETVIKREFDFLGSNTVAQYLALLIPTSSMTTVENATNTILGKIWEYYGISMLQANVDSYTNVQSTQIDSGWSVKDHANYYLYWANYMLLTSCQKKLDAKNKQLTNTQKSIDTILADMQVISNKVDMANNFTTQQLVRLNAFLREDEYSDSNFIIADDEKNSEVIRSKYELLQCGKVELNNLCQPRLSFSATLANIYACEEFSPIVNQFQLGNMVRISLRPDYIKKTRLMKVEINFEDFSDFSAEFGDLISIKSPADIHADLLQQAVQAGKSVASNSSYWDKGTDLATQTDIKLQQGLLDVNQKIKAIDGTQNVEIDKYGIHMKKVDPTTGEVDPKQAWLVNNLLCYTDDNWKTTKSALGEFTADGKTLYGLLAEAVIAGYIEGSAIVGGTIKIGDRGDGTYNFEVDKNGNMTSISGPIKDQIDDLDEQVQKVSNIEIGGRNLLLSSRHFTGWPISNTGSTSKVPIDNEDFTLCHFDNVETKDWRSISSKPLPVTQAYGRTMTLSFEYKSDDWQLIQTSSGENPIYITFDGCSNDSVTRTKYRMIFSASGSGKLPQLFTSGNWKRCTFTFTVGDTESWFTSGSGAVDRCRIRIYNYSIYKLDVRKVKLEYGDKPTDWSPAPEDMDVALDDAKTELIKETTAAIYKTQNDILQTVKDTYYTADDVDHAIQTVQSDIKQKSDEIDLSFTGKINDLSAETNDRFTPYENHITFTKDGNIVLSAEDSDMSCVIEKTQISFCKNGNAIAYLSGDRLYVKDGEFLNALYLGNFAFIPRKNGNLSFKKVV